VSHKDSIDGGIENNSFPKQLRLLKASQFERVFKARNSASDQWIGLNGAANELGYPRLGLTVSRRCGGAVERNRWKRLLREAFRLSQHSLPAVDFVCVVRAQEPPGLEQLKRSVTSLAARISKKAAQQAHKIEKNAS